MQIFNEPILIVSYFFLPLYASYFNSFWMMMFVKYLIFVFSLLILFSCKSDYTENKEILKAESLLKSYPDSAYQILRSISHPETLPEKDYAAWCLHYTNAQYKLYLDDDLKSDSLIKIAVNYFSHKQLPLYSGLSYYLLGCVELLNASNFEAMKNFKIAEGLLSETNENEIKGLVDFRIGATYMDDQLYVQALKYYKRSCVQFKTAETSKYQVCAYREISSMYDQLYFPMDTVLYYSNLGLKISKQTADSINYYQILAQQGIIMHNTYPEQAKDKILEAYRFLPDQRSYYAAYLSYIYSKLNMFDSAKFYLQVSLSDTTDLKSNNLRYLAAAYVERKLGNYDKAFQYIEDSYYLRDSVFNENKHCQLYRIDKQYDLTEKNIENAELSDVNRNSVICIALLVIAISIVIVFSLLTSVRYKWRQKQHNLEKQLLESEIQKRVMENCQKKELLLSKLQSKIENTLRFNKLKVGLLQQDKQDRFLEEVTMQSVITEDEIKFYIDEVNELFDGKISQLVLEFPQLTQSDLIVIAFICLKIDISDCCNLLNMAQNTLYTRRKRIKKRLSLDSDDMDEWLLNFMEAN